MPSTMSCDGIAIGEPCAGDRMLLLDSISTDASICASGDSGMWTAIWSPSKSALKAVQTSGWIRIALPSTSTDRRRVERVDAQPGKRRRAVQQHRVLANHFLEHVPHFRTLELDHLLRLLD